MLLEERNSLILNLLHIAKGFLEIELSDQHHELIPIKLLEQIETLPLKSFVVLQLGLNQIGFSSVDAGVVGEFA
ncbi:Uncharacterised protein [Acinetobacter baumannii]|nr:Uncharacterised protein [Acinetobacter baumannii]